METIEHPRVAEVFEAYPADMREKLLFLRQLVFETAAETDGVDAVEETLKWGEPSYIADRGTTIRMDWKESSPTQYALYFHCQTRLIDTFEEVYGDYLSFEGNRAIVFDEDDEVPVDELKHCLSLALTYHDRSHLPLLGA